MWKSQLRITRQAIKENPRGAAVIVLVWLLLAMVFVLRGGPLDVFFVVTIVGLLGILIAPSIERAIMGKEYYSYIEDFSHDRLVPLIDELRAKGIDLELVDMPFKDQDRFQPLAPSESFDHLAYLRLLSHYVDAIHIGNWRGIKSKMEAFYFDFAVECEIQDEADR